MLDPITEPFTQGIAQRALIECVIIGLACGPLGVWVVLHRRSYAAESLAHAMLPGLVGAALLGVPLGFGAAAGLAVAALAIAGASRQRSIGPDVAVAVAVTALFGLGAVLALSPEAPPRLGELLFGDPLGVTRDDIAVSAVGALAIIAALAALHRPLALSAFDPGVAPGLGVSPGLVGLALLALLAGATLLAVSTLGNLLVVALIVAPAATALRLTTRLARALPLAAALGAGAGVGGLYLSHYAELAAGASIALVAVAMFALSLPAGRRRAAPSRGRRPGAVESIAAAS